MNFQKAFSIRFLALFLGGIMILIAACTGTDYVPKPHGYPRVVLPPKGYEPYSPMGCPFSFEKPTYSVISKDSTFARIRPDDPCWLNLDFPNLNAQIHLSYKAIDRQNTLTKLINDAYKLNMKHVKMASAMEDSLFRTANGVVGVYYVVEGNAASSTQFYLTDSLKNFMWASLYFREAPNEDSIAPIVRFLRQDIDHMVKTFAWK